MWMNFLLRTLAWQTLLEKNGRAFKGDHKGTGDHSGIADGRGSENRTYAYTEEKRW